jgi:hypothetical protein
MRLIGLTLALACITACSGDSGDVTSQPLPSGGNDNTQPRSKLQLSKTDGTTRGTTQTQSVDPGEAAVAIAADECSAMADGGPVAGPGCVTAEIKCGDVIKGHTLGGTKSFNTKWYEKNFCTPGLTDHDGGDERVYLLNVPAGDHLAEVTLDTPCADLDLAAFKYKGDDCPVDAFHLPQCDMWPKDGNQREHVKLVSQKATKWWIVVEGKGEEEGAFALTVECRNSLY